MSLDMFVQRQQLSPEGSSPPFSSPVYVRDRPNAMLGVSFRYHAPEPLYAALETCLGPND